MDSARRGAALQEEMELHLAEKAAELEAGGMTAERAQAEARRRFGNVTLKQEESREIWMTRYLSELGQDIRYGWRTMTSNKAFSALAILSLALGIGANTAIYSLMESILMRALPVAEPESLVVLNWTSQPPQNASKEWVHVVHGIQGILWPGDRGALVTGMFPYPAFETLRQETAAFSTLFGYFNGRKHNLAVRGQAVSAATEYVSGEYFRGLAVAPAAGRLIEAEDDRAGAAPVAVISFAASQNRFGGAPAAIGQAILVDNVAFTVIGVTPPEFFGVDPASVPDLYLPLHSSVLVEGPASAQMFGDENFYWLEMMGRLRPGVSMAQAQAVLAPRFRQWVAGTAKSDGERAKLPAMILNPGAAGLGQLRREYSKPLYVLLAMVGLILAITCVNLANLLLARAAARRREMAIRLSLGAGRLRVVRQLLTECVMLASLGGALGVLFAVWGVRWLTFLFSRGREDFTLHAELNWHVLIVTAALSVVCGLVFGLVPAIQSTRPDVIPALKDGRGGAARQRTQHVLVVAQIAMSFLILVAAGLFVQTLDKLHSVQLGYARENILLFSLNARQTGHRDPEIATFYAELRKRFESIPGVSSATLAQSSIISAGHAGKTYRGAMKIGSVAIDGASVMTAGPRFLTTMQIPILAGREIDDRDEQGSKAVAVISERLARTYFPNENPVGQRITLVDDKREVEIVGVSGNLRNGGLKSGDSKAMTVFIAASQASPEGVTYALRTAGDPLRYVTSVHEIVREADASMPVTNVITQAAEIDRTISREVMFARLCTGFAILALLTACVGLYGTMSYNVTRQFGEIGLRMALGAQRGTMVWMVLRRVLLLAAVGLAISVPVTLAATRLVKSLLFGTQPNDPGTMALAGAVLLSAACLAGYGPARRASRIDPLVALRHD
ncbi:ABC transporter permease [Paludibaculum fermentans]|uniref:ABC transporter permease n=1 Tax=Paludibaculum fermentans TaxID=1473598 RepID=A0A7S7NV25_PALFE|nr:ABC transporter permease [Paludibaculum fermentans]QOY90362.1 ABC transporter permease [Paludibaculum fermentans]